MRFQNKIAIVTGGASDLGRDLAGLFIKEGGFVVIGDHIAARVDAVARKAGLQPFRLLAPPFVRISCRLL